MSFSNKLCLLFVLSLALVLSCSAQNSPQDFLDAHNSARGLVGVSNITWNATVASYALNYATSRNGNCTLVHSGGPYGENLAWGSSSTFSGVDGVTLWVNEKKDYTYASNSCALGKVCGHYTQVVWKNSTSLGCARTPCTTTTGWYVICSYYTPGNYNNQKPY